MNNSFVQSADADLKRTLQNAGEFRREFRLSRSENECRDNRALNELCSPMNPSAHSLRHFGVDRNTVSEDDLFGEAKR